MKGGGYYSQSTRGAKDVIDRATPIVLDAAAAIPAPLPDRPLQIADFGCADGGTSKAAIFATIEALRARFAGHQILVTYTDLPSNDYSQLFKNLLGLTGDADFNYLAELSRVFAHACGVGFHPQLIPDATLDIGFSATAMHYLSEKAMEIPDHVHMVGATGAVLDAYAARAAADWEAILLARARELRPGGRLVLMNFGKDERGRYLGNTGGVNMFDTIDQHWRAMAEASLITRDAYGDASFSQFYRTKEEFAAPLRDPASPVHRAGLRLTSAHTGFTECPYRAAFEAADGAMSARDFAASYVPTLLFWSETVFANALDPARPAAERAELVDAFYQRYEDIVSADPTGHAMDYVHCYLAIEKVETE